MSAISAYGQSAQYSPYGNSSAGLGSTPLSDFLTQMDNIINADANTPEESSDKASSAVASGANSTIQTGLMKILFEILSNQTQSPVGADTTANAASSNTDSLLQQKASSSYSASSDYGAIGQSGGISFSA